MKGNFWYFYHSPSTGFVRGLGQAEPHHEAEAETSTERTNLTLTERTTTGLTSTEGTLIVYEAERTRNILTSTDGTRERKTSTETTERIYEAERTRKPLMSMTESGGFYYVVQGRGRNRQVKSSVTTTSRSKDPGFSADFETRKIDATNNTEEVIVSPVYVPEDHDERLSPNSSVKTIVSPSKVAHSRSESRPVSQPLVSDSSPPKTVEPILLCLLYYSLSF